MVGVEVSRSNTPQMGVGMFCCHNHDGREWLSAFASENIYMSLQAEIEGRVKYIWEVEE